MFVQEFRGQGKGYIFYSCSWAGRWVNSPVHLPAFVYAHQKHRNKVIYEKGLKGTVSILVSSNRKCTDENVVLWQYLHSLISPSVNLFWCLDLYELLLLLKLSLLMCLNFAFMLSLDSNVKSFLSVNFLYIWLVSGPVIWSITASTSL